MITTVAEVDARIREIYDHKGDDEMQHSLEDDIMREFIAAVADGAVDSQEARRMAVRVAELNESTNFSRWYG